MSQACPSCARSWDDRATFCGACGARLEADGPPPGTTASRGPYAAGGRPRWRWAVLAVAALVGIGLAVPVVTVDRTPPVEGDVGVPDTDALQPAGSAGDDGKDPEAERNGRTDGSRTTPPPNVSCWRDDSVVELPCVLWVRRVLGQRSTGLELALADAATLVTVGPGTLRGFDARSGEQRWERPLGRPVDTAALGDRVGALHVGGQVHAFALRDGRRLWSGDAFSPLYGQSVVDGLVHAADRDADGPKLVVRDAVDGSVRWEARTDDASIFSLLDHTSAGALVATHDNRLLFLDRSAGEPVWEVGPGMQVLDVREGLLVVAEPPEGGARDPGADDAGTTIRAIGLPDGTVRWQRTLPAGDAPLAVQGDLVLAPSPSRLTAVDVATGHLRWTIASTTELERVATRHASGLPSPPLDAGTVLTFGSRSGTLRARDPASGTLRWEHPASGGLGSVMPHDGYLLVPLREGLVAIDPATGRELLRVRSGGSLHPAGAGAELLVHHRSGYAVRFDFPDRRTLRQDP